ncbi:hypothetical protein H1R20_g13662, partial [Candolleomyces eurysporus]
MVVGQVEVHSFLKAGHEALGDAGWDVHKEAPGEVKARINLNEATPGWSKENATTPPLHSISITSRILPAGDTIEVVGEGGGFVTVDDVLTAMHERMSQQEEGINVQWVWHGLTPGSTGEEWNLILY